MIREKAFLNGTILLIDGAFLNLAICSSVNIYQVFEGVYEKNGSYYVSIVVLTALGVYTLAQLGYLNFKFDRLRKRVVRARIGVAYENLAYKKVGKCVLVYKLLEFLRKFGLCFVVTFAKPVLIAQLLFMNYSCLILAVFIALV